MLSESLAAIAYKKRNADGSWSFCGSSRCGFFAAKSSSWPHFRLEARFDVGVLISRHAGFEQL